MKICLECNLPQLEGSLFCTECGAGLSATDSLATAASLTTVFPFKEFTSPTLPPPVATALRPVKNVQKRMVFVIPQSRRRVKLTLEEQLYVGRADPKASLQPELDLTGDAGETEGVSRIHAVIQLVAEGVVLRDLNSTNGTLLNDYQLEPETPYLLRSGNEVRFGNLLVHILFD